MHDYVASRSEAVQNKKKRKLLLYTSCIFLLALIVGLFFFIRSGIFETKETQISDTSSVFKSDIVNHVDAIFIDQSKTIKWLFGERNILTLKTKKLITSLLETFPSIQAVEVKKNIPEKKLSLMLAERQKTGVWCGVTCVWFDEEGVAFQEGLQVEGNILYKIEDATARTVVLGDKILPDHEFKNLFRVFEFLKTIGWNTKTLLYEDATFGDLKTPAVQDYPVIYFSLENDPMYAADSIQKLNIEDLEYIDLRVQGRIYYR